MLPERVDINSDTVDLAGETALSRAQKNGHHAIVELLSKRKNPTPRPNGDKSTVLAPLGRPIRINAAPKGTVGSDGQHETHIVSQFLELSIYHPRLATG